MPSTSAAGADATSGKVPLAVPAQAVVDSLRRTPEVWGCRQTIAHFENLVQVMLRAGPKGPDPAKQVV